MQGMAKPEQVNDASLATARLRCIPFRLLRCLPFFGGHRRLLLRFLIRLALFGHAIHSSSVRPSVRYPMAIRAAATIGSIYHVPTALRTPGSFRGYSGPPGALT